MFDSSRPTTPIRRPVSVWLLSLSLVFGLSVLGSGCSYESSLGSVTCNEESSRSQGRVCRDGLWVEELDAHGVDDASDAVDTVDDADATADTDASTCPGGQTMCGATCVDTDSNADHCGACNSPCTEFGDHSIAACEVGACERTCAAGWTDANGDWAGTSGGTTDGCELACTPSEDPAEVCDGVDNDCNGVIDDDLTTRYYLDADQDGFGVTIDFRDLCAPEGDYTSTEDGDCNDDDPQVHPTAAGTCNGVDDNCDGEIDTGCDCVNGETMPCYSGAASTQGVGPCQAGTTTCADGSWGGCQNEVIPQTEVCDSVDNDCDAQTDEGVLNTYYADADSDGYGDASSTAMACTSPHGHVANADDCDDSRVEAHPSSADTCNGLDDDCDNVIDEGFTDKGDACTVGVGTCENSGTLVCSADGTATECSVSPHAADANETCGDNLDNNCNGLVNDGCPCTFNNDADGVCGTATLVEQGTCAQPSTYEADETICDGLDNDCDGDVDENLRTTYLADLDADGYPDTSSTIEACAKPNDYILPRMDGENDCDDGDPWTHPSAAEICDGRDNNCNTFEADDGGNSTRDWCRSRFNNSAFSCRESGPNNTLCCEEGNDGDFDCDAESVCDNGVDEDGDNDIDCADINCDGLYCGPGMICSLGTCQAI